MRWPVGAQLLTALVAASSLVLALAAPAAASSQRAPAVRVVSLARGAAGANSTPTTGHVPTGRPTAVPDPSAPVTRAQWIRMLVLAAGLPTADAGAQATFTDVPRSAWEFPYVEAASRRGLIRGAPGGTFGPGRDVSRQDVAVTLGRALGLQAVARALPPPPFGDTGTIAPHARGYVAAAVDLGLMSALRGGSFGPLQPITGSEAATILKRYRALTAGGGLRSLAAQAARIALQLPKPTLTAGAAEPVGVVVLGATGQPLVVPATLDASGGTLSPSGVFTAGPPGTATLGARVGTVSTTVHLRIIPHPVRLAWSPEPPSSVRAGSTVALSLSVDLADGTTDSQDGGRTVDVAVQGPAGTAQQLTATDDAGRATIRWAPHKAGAYRLTASAAGLAGPPAASLTVVPGPPADLVVSVTPDTLTVMDQNAAVYAGLRDALGNPVNEDVSVTVSVTRGGPVAAGKAGGSGANGGGSSAGGGGGAGSSAGGVGFGGTGATQGGGGGGGPAGEVGFGGAMQGGGGRGAGGPASTVRFGGATRGGGGTAGGAAAGRSPGSSPGAGSGQPPAGPPGYVTPAHSTIEGDWSQVATFSPGPGAGTVTVTVAAASLGLSGSRTVHLRLNPVIALLPGPSAPVEAGHAATVRVRVEAPGGSPSQDSGRTVTLHVKGPGGAVSTLTATDTDGLASFTVSETAAGTYDLAASAPGTVPASGGRLTVSPGPPAALRLVPTPSFLVAPGGTARLHLQVVDRYGNPVPEAVSVHVQASGTGSLRDVVPEVQSGQTVAVWSGHGQAATGTVTVAVPGSTLPPAKATLTQLTTAAGVVAGKGMWLRYQDMKAYGAKAIVTRAVQMGVSHLYLEVGSTYRGDGFWGARQLDELLPEAHRHHIAVIGWIYDTLYDPAADVSLAQTAAGFTTPGGQRVDGLALDLETNSTMVPAVVTPFGHTLRQDLGAAYPLVAVTYPPQLRPGYPFAQLAAFANVIAPMDYWHYDPRLYSPQQAAAFVRQSVVGLRRLSGDASLPVSVIGQSYDMFARSEQGRFSPTAAEVSAAMAAAKAIGAVGFSLYRWGTATAAEMGALAGDPWP